MRPGTLHVLDAVVARGDLTTEGCGGTWWRMEGTPPDDGGAVGSVVAALGGDSQPSMGPDFCRGAQPEEGE